MERERPRSLLGKHYQSTSHIRKTSLTFLLSTPLVEAINLKVAPSVCLFSHEQRQQHLQSSRKDNLLLVVHRLHVLCNIPHSGIKRQSHANQKRVIIFFLYIYIYIHGLRIKIYRHFDRVPPIPESPKLLTWNLFTLLIASIS